MANLTHDVLEGHDGAVERVTGVCAKGAVVEIVATFPNWQDVSPARHNDGVQIRSYFD